MKDAALLELQAGYPLRSSPEYGVGKVLATGKGEVMAGVTPEMIEEYGRDEEHKRLLRVVTPRSYMVVPLPARGRTLGTMVFIATERERAYTADDLQAAEDLAARCALAVDNARLVRETEGSLALLDTLFETAPIGLGFFDAELRYQRVNDALAEINGVSREEHLGRTLPEVLPGLDPQAVESFRNVLETGRPLIDQEVTGETPAQPGRERHWLSSFYPVRDESGGTIGLGCVVIEITERKRAEAERAQLLALERTSRKEAEAAQKRLAFLAEASALLDSSLDYDATLRNTTRLVVPFLADWCVIDMLTPEGGIERRAVAHADPRREELGWELGRRYPPKIHDAAGAGAVIRTGRPVLASKLTQERIETLAPDPDHLRMLDGLGLQSSITVALRARGRVIGALAMVTAESGRVFGDEELSLAEELGARCALAADNAALYRDAQLAAQRERGVARTLQASLLPPSPPEIPGVEVATRYRPAGEGNEVGGDFYDIFPTRGGWAVVIGDVCGKGPAAAAITGLARHTVRIAANYERDPCSVLRVLNDALLAEPDDGRFMTVAFCRFEPTAAGARLTISCGGHPPPLILRADGSVEEAAAPGTVLGLLDGPRLLDSRADMASGDTLILFTDGVTEARTHSGILGDQRFRQMLVACSGCGATELINSIEEDLVELQDGDPRDDIALIAIRTP
ncbi:MAG: SpoIIE family protein phosphatase [Thermoleophilaceae bacterium]|nr:SpoIIE family protein phosphatase [Thermoleophilaceae bacterium]